VRTRNRDGHKTASIRRPRTDEPTAPTATGYRRDTTRPPTALSRLADRTRPTAADKRLVTGARNRALIALAAVAIITALLAALFILPVQAWFRQRDDIATRTRDLEVIRDSNAQLQAEITRLNTDDGARQAARDELGYVQRGERRYLAVNDDALSMTMPSGWPYDTVGRVLVARGVVLAPPAAPPT
jgi:cell division protein FtsB